MSPSPPRRWMQAMGNPFVLGGVALVVAVAAAVAVAVALGRGSSETIALAPDDGQERPTATAAATAEVSGLTARALTTVTLRSGPGVGFISLGVVARGYEMEVVAKSDSEQWLEVVYPPGTRLHGWVELKDVEFAGDLAGLPVGGAEVFVLPAVPTYVPVPIEDEVPTPAATGPDLVPTDAFVVGEVLAVTVTNVGDQQLAPQVIEVGVYDASLSRIIAASQAGPLSLGPGQSINVGTGFRVAAGDSRRVVIVIDPAQSLDEADHSNNSVVFVLTGTAPTSTPGGRAPSMTATPHPFEGIMTPSVTPAESPTAAPREIATATPVPPTATGTVAASGGG